MTLSSSIQHAIAVSFSEQDQPAVITLLERLVPQWPGSVERTQAAILVLAYQDRMAVQDLIDSAGGDSIFCNISSLPTDMTQNSPVKISCNAIGH